MTIEEVRNSIGEIVWHIGLGKVKIEWDESTGYVKLSNPNDPSQFFFENQDNLQRLELIKQHYGRIRDKSK